MLSNIIYILRMTHIFGAIDKIFVKPQMPVNFFVSGGWLFTPYMSVLHRQR